MAPTASGSPNYCPPSAVAADSDLPLLRLARAGDLGAREELVRRFLPLARRIAARYRHGGIGREDLEQVAALGLIKAIDRYDPDLGGFLGYAVPTIVGELKRCFRDRGWGMRIPRALQECFLEVNHAVDELSGQLGRSPTPAEIAEHTGLELERVLEGLDVGSAYTPAALDASWPGDDDDARTLADSIGRDDPHYEFVDIGQTLAPAFRSLPPRERRIIKLRFVDDLTQSEIADRVGISQMHVSRLLRRALERLGASAGDG